MSRAALMLGLITCLALWSAPPASAQDEEAPHVRATLASDFDALAPGQTTTLVVRLQIKPEWHIYWLNPGDAGVPTKLELTLPKGVVGVPRWPAPKRLAHEDGFVDFSYEGEVLLLVPLRIAEGAAPKLGGKVSVGLKVTWLVCKEVCIPGQAELALTLPVRAERAARPAVAKQVQAAQARLAQPLPQKVRARLQGLKLEIEAPGAKGLTWFPLRPEASGPEDLGPLVAEGAKLSVSYPSDVRKSKKIKGLLAIRGPKHTTYHWVEVPSSRPPE